MRRVLCALVGLSIASAAPAGAVVPPRPPTPVRGFELAGVVDIESAAAHGIPVTVHVAKRLRVLHLYVLTRRLDPARRVLLFDVLRRDVPRGELRVRLAPVSRYRRALLRRGHLNVSLTMSAVAVSGEKMRRNQAFGLVHRG